MTAAVLGAQRPRFCHVPPAVSSSGAEAVDLAKMAGLHLDDWEAFVLAQSLGERPNGKWSAFEVGVIVSRQNGKGAILEARELAGLFLLGERFITHSAHQFDTSLEAFRRLLGLIEEHPEFSRRVKRVSRSHGEEGIELTNRQRIRFRTRTKGGGRGFTGDCLILDEAMDLPASAHGALLPTLSARPNPQVWYAGSAVDQEVHEHGTVLASIRQRGHRGDDPALAYFEWCSEGDLDTVHELASDPAAWADANPALGIRISLEHIEREQRAMGSRTFAVERLGVGDWPSLEDIDQDGITDAMWEACYDGTSSIVDPVRFAFDVRPDRSKAAIVAAGFREDGLRHIEVVEHKSRTHWIVDRIAELQARHKTAGPVVLDDRSPAAALVPQLVERGIPFTAIGGSDYARACGAFFDDVDQQQIRHLGTADLAAAATNATKRPLGDAWAWSRKNSAADISPVVAATLALWGLGRDPVPPGPLVAVFGR